MRHLPVMGGLLRGVAMRAITRVMEDLDAALVKARPSIVHLWLMQIGSNKSGWILEETCCHQVVMQAAERLHLVPTPLPNHSHFPVVQHLRTHR